MRNIPAFPLATGLILLVGACGCHARSPVCETLMASYEALDQVSDWQGTTHAGDGEVLQSRKVAGRQQFKPPGGDWMDLPASAIAAGRAMVESMRADDGSITNCEIVGSDTVDGVAVTAIRAHIKPEGVPAYEATIHIGADGLPYRQVSDAVQVDYRYGRND